MGRIRKVPWTRVQQSKVGEPRLKSKGKLGGKKITLEENNKRKVFYLDKLLNIRNHKDLDRGEKLFAIKQKMKEIDKEISKGAELAGVKKVYQDELEKGKNEYENPVTGLKDFLSSDPTREAVEKYLNQRLIKKRDEVATIKWNSKDPVEIEESEKKIAQFEEAIKIARDYIE